MRHFAHRVSRRVGSLHCAARGAIGFLRSLRSATKLSGTDDRRDKKKASLRLFEFASVLVRRDHIACFIALDWRKVSTNIKKPRRGAILSFRCPHLANTCQNRLRFRAFRCGTVRNRRLVNLPDFSLANWLFRGADDGIRTHTPPSRERILSPLRLPFRHIGAVKIILVAFCYPTNRDLMGITFAKQCPKRREESVFPVRNSCSRQRDLRPADFGSCLVRLSFSENHPHAGGHETRPEKRPQRKLFATDRPASP